MIEGWVRDGARRCVFFVNADCMNITARDADYHASLAAPRRCGVRGRHRDQARRTAQPAAGPRQCQRYGHVPAAVRTVREKTGRLFFCSGAADDIAERAGQRMQEQFPGVQIVGTRHGYFDLESCDDVIDTINASGADILLVGLGVPRQEHFIRRYRARLRPTVAMGVGGLFDFYSGRIKRAPKVLRNNGLEWTWRLAMEPRRLWRRYLVGNFTFMGRVMWWQVKGRNRPWAS